MTKYIQFLSLSTGYIPGTIPPQFGALCEPIEMLGSDGVYPLDGRWCSATVHRKAREVGVLRKAVGYRLCHGLTSNGWTQQSKDFLLENPS